MIDNLTLWGNYSIPKDNPYFTDRTFRPEVYSYGLRNPWRCSYDAERPSYIFCGDTGEVILSSHFSTELNVIFQITHL